MKILDLKVGYLCNNHCLHCAIDDYRQELINHKKQTELSTHEIFSLLEDNKFLYDSVVLTGGEISIRKDFIQIVRKALECYSNIQIQTNARKITQEQACFLANPKIHLAVALHGSTSDIHDKITQVPHSFDQTIQALRYLSSYGANVCIKVVISRYNYQDLLNIVKLAYELNLYRINFAYVHGCGNARINYKDLFVSYDNIYNYLSRALDFCDQHNIFADLETFPFCKIPIKHFSKSADLALQDNFSDSIPTNEDKYNWDEVRQLEQKRKSQQCFHCVFDNVCEGIWQENAYDVLQPIICAFPKLQKPCSKEKVNLIVLSL